MIRVVAAAAVLVPAVVTASPPVGPWVRPLVTVSVCGTTYPGVTPELAHQLQTGMAEFGGGLLDGRRCGGGG
jgi:hypothetical protein